MLTKVDLRHLKQSSLEKAAQWTFGCGGKTCLVKLLAAPSSFRTLISECVLLKVEAHNEVGQGVTKQQYLLLDKKISNDSNDIFSFLDSRLFQTSPLWPHYDTSIFRRLPGGRFCLFKPLLSAMPFSKPCVRSKAWPAIFAFNFFFKSSRGTAGSSWNSSTSTSAWRWDLPKMFEWLQKQQLAVL